MLILGHRCKKGDTTTNWQLYSVNPSDKSATLAASASQKGAFAAFARSNNIYLSTDGKQALFSVPDGVTANTVGFKRVSISDLSISDVIDKEVVAATYNGSANAFPRVSPDGKWLAARTAEGSETVRTGSRMATRNAAFGSPHAIFACVAASEIRA